MRKMLLWLLILMMVMPVALQEEQPAEEMSQILVATVQDQKIYLSDVENYAYQLYASGVTYSPTDYITAFEFLLKYKVLSALKVEEIGAKEILGEEGYALAVENATAQYQAEITSYVQYYYGTNLSEEEMNTLYDNALAAYEAAGFTLDAYVTEYVNGEAFATLLVSQTPTASDEEVQALFAEFVEADRLLFENDISTYEIYTGSYGYQALYTPAGYRGITHILLSADEAALAAYSAAKETGDEAAIREAADKVVAGIQDTVDLIYDSIEGGAEFESLIAEFGTDPGMQNEYNLENGYAVHAMSSRYVQEFTDGSFSDKMQKVGDVSDPVVTDYGVHILYYLRDIPAGPVELTDDLYYQIYNYAVSSKQDAMLEAWLNEYEVVVEEEYQYLLG